MRQFPAVLVSSLAAAALTACAVGPDYRQPQPDAPARFRGQIAIDQRQAADTADLAQWWDGFNDPLLSRLVAQSLRDNLELAQAVARVSQSRAALGSATAALLPSGEVSAQTTRAHSSRQTPLGQVLSSTPGFDRDGSLYEASIGTGWEIDVFGGRRRDREAAMAEYQASQAGTAAARLAIAAQTADTYVAIRGLQDRLEVARRQLDTQQRLLATVRMQHEAGVVAELQLHQAEGAVAQVEATVPVLEAALDSTLNALDVLLGVQPGTYRDELMVPVSIPVAPAIAGAGGPADLLRRRPDLIVAERRLAAAHARIGSAIAEYYPSFSLGGLLGTATTSSGNLFESGANQAQAVLGLRWRLFDFGRIESDIAMAKGRNVETLAAYRLAVLRASEDVENAFSMLVRREAQERSLRGGEIALARARDNSLAAYQGGVVSLIEVLDTDARLLATRDARAVARTEAAHAAVASFRALGGGWEPSKLVVRAN